jgi:hypothetical protein
MRCAGRVGGLEVLDADASQGADERDEGPSMLKKA